MHQTQFSEKIPYGGFSQIRSHIGNLGPTSEPIFPAIDIVIAYFFVFIIGSPKLKNELNQDDKGIHVHVH